MNVLHTHSKYVVQYAPSDVLCLSLIHIFTDSGNVAEEATFLGIPCMTLSTYAEHPETVTIGTNRLVGESSEILADVLEDVYKRQFLSHSETEYGIRHQPYYQKHGVRYRLVRSAFGQRL